MNSESLFDKQSPTAAELIKFVSQKFVLNMNEEKFHRQALAAVITKFVLYFEGKENFWRSDNFRGEFPWNDYKTTLTNFLGEKSLWKPIVNYNLKQEHLCVLFYIAALRYRALPLPIFQKKYVKENESQNPHTDLFLFDGNGEKKAAFAVQPRLLTKSDMGPDGELNHASYRSLEYVGKDLANAQAVRHEGIALAQSFTYSLNNEDAKTRNFVVNVNPYGVTWDDCGVYEETLTSQTLNSAQPRPRNQMDPSQNTNNDRSAQLLGRVQDNNMNPLQNSQSPPSSQNQASQGLHFGQSNFKNQAKEYPKKKNNQSYLIIPNNSRDPNPNFNYFSAKQLKPASSYNQKSQKTWKPSKYSAAKVNQNSQNEDYFEADPMMDREERQVFHPIFRRNGFRKEH